MNPNSFDPLWCPWGQWSQVAAASTSEQTLSKKINGKSQFTQERFEDQERYWLSARRSTRFFCQCVS